MIQQIKSRILDALDTWYWISLFRKDPSARTAESLEHEETIRRKTKGSTREATESGIVIISSFHNNDGAVPSGLGVIVCAVDDLVSLGNAISFMDVDALKSRVILCGNLSHSFAWTILMGICVWIAAPIKPVNCNLISLLIANRLPKRSTCWKNSIIPYFELRSTAFHFIEDSNLYAWLVFTVQPDESKANF